MGASMIVHDATNAAWYGLSCMSMQHVARYLASKRGMRVGVRGGSEDARAVCRYLYQINVSGPIPKELSALTSLERLCALLTQCM